jgi:serine/threonine protein kinase
MHRNIKKENLLINPQNLSIKIGDLGSAKILDGSINNPYTVSRYYRALKLILAFNEYGCEVDIWL